MFDIKDEYIKESESASINQHNDNNSNLFLKSLFIVSTIGVIGYFGFNYINSNENVPKKSKVMGVSHINPNETTIQTPLAEKDNSHIRDNIKDIVNNYEESIKVQYEKNKPQDISNELNNMVDSFYNKKASIPIELSGMVDEFYKEDSKESKNRVITVKKGDTLALIAQRFYGNAMKYPKIVDANRELKKSKTLYIGQKINIPY